MPVKNYISTNFGSPVDAPSLEDLTVEMNKLSSHKARRVARLLNNFNIFKKSFFSALPSLTRGVAFNLISTYENIVYSNINQLEKNGYSKELVVS